MVFISQGSPLFLRWCNTFLLWIFSQGLSMKFGIKMFVGIEDLETDELVPSSGECGRKKKDFVYLNYSS